MNQKTGQDPHETTHTNDLDVSRGIAWGVLLSIPLWLSFFGWLTIIF